MIFWTVFSVITLLAVVACLLILWKYSSWSWRRFVKIRGEWEDAIQEEVFTDPKVYDWTQDKEMLKLMEEHPEAFEADI